VGIPLAAIGEADPLVVFRSASVPDYPLWATSHCEPVVRWYAGMGAVLRSDGNTWLWVAANSADALAAVRNALPGDWLVS
jgi:hypothetical protein